MLKRSLSLATAALFAALAPVALRAQTAARPVFDQVTVGGGFGGLSGAADADQAGANSWRLGWAASLDATGWLNDYVGIRATGGWAQDSLDGTAAGLVGRGKFNKFSYDADLVLRYPIKSGSGWILPYVLGGAGAISIHQLDASDTRTKFAGNFGAGLEYRFGRAGVRAEARDNVYKLDRYGFDKTQHDIAWQGGVTLSF